MAPSGSSKDLLSSFKTGAADFHSRSSSFLRGRRSNVSDITTTSSADPDDGGAPTTTSRALPLPEVKFPFPVVEQPSRIILKSLDSPHFEVRRLTSGRRGAVSVTSSRGDAEQFMLIPVVVENDNNGAVETGDDGCVNDGKMNDSFSDEKCGAKKRRKDVFYLRSYKFNRYLSSDSVTGAVTTIDLTKKGKDDSSNTQHDDQLQSESDNDFDGQQQKESKQSTAKQQPGQLGESEKWLLMPSPHGGHFLVSVQNKKNVACIQGEESLRIGLRGANDRSESWEVEFVSGELCFLSSPPSEEQSSSFSAKEGETSSQQQQQPSKRLQIRCDLIGKLTLTADRRGWEVWRFVETGGG